MRITMVISLQVLTDSGISTVRTSLTEMPKDSSQVMFSYSYIVACILILTKFPPIPTSTDICLSWESDESYLALHGHQSQGSDRECNLRSVYVHYWNSQGRQSGSVFSYSYIVTSVLILSTCSKFSLYLKVSWRFPGSSRSSNFRFRRSAQYVQGVHILWGSTFGYVLRLVCNHFFALTDELL
jgi:hypothetical protein